MLKLKQLLNKKKQSFIYLLFHVLCQKAISAIVYIRIGFTIASLGQVCSVVNEEQRDQLDFKKRRRILLLVLIILIFAICWLPFHIYYLLADLQITNYNFRIFLVVNFITHKCFTYLLMKRMLSFNYIRLISTIILIVITETDFKRWPFRKSEIGFKARA